MASVKAAIGYFIALLSRYPGIVALFGFISGVASFLLVERQESLARIIAAIMLISWCWLVLENTLRQALARWLGIDLPAPLLRIATQMVHQESLFFALPFFVITTTWLSSQAIFTVLLIIAALTSVLDPIYNRLAARRWLYISFHALTFFAVLLATLPVIFHITTEQSYQLALLVSVIFTFPSLSALMPAKRWWRAPLIIVLTLALSIGGWHARLWVPPATLWLTEVAVTQEINNSEKKAGQSLAAVSTHRLHSEGLYAYTAIRAPKGLNEKIFHVWLLDGREVDRIALNIHGGRKEGYRAWTHKQNFPTQPDGNWQIQVLTEAGQMIGRLTFEVKASIDAKRSSPLRRPPPEKHITEEALPNKPLETKRLDTFEPLEKSENEVEKRDQAPADDDDIQDAEAEITPEAIIEPDSIGETKETSDTSAADQDRAAPEEPEEFPQREESTDNALAPNDIQVDRKSFEHEPVMLP
jgi:uncharacterized protein DUF5924/DUF2914 family protein